MNTTELEQAFRQEVRDLAPPYLWSQTEILAYANDAQNALCRLGGGIGDSTSALTRIDFAPNTEYVDISPRILKLRAVHLESTGEELRIMNHEDYYLRGGTRRLGNLIPGPVKAVVTGMTANKLMLVDIPIDTDALRLVLYRMPLESLTEPFQDLEVDEYHHRPLLMWMKHLAHMKQDAETYDRGRSEQYGMDFRAYCDQVKREREMSEHKQRTVAYGGY